jgi:hypothetical protein
LCGFIFPDFGEENTPLEEQGLCAAKFILRCTQHTLLFAQMQILFARKGHHLIPKSSGTKPDFCQAFFECRNKLKTDMNPLSRFMQQSYILK